MRAALIWIINDFPAYANLSGWRTKGNLACPNCPKDTCSNKLWHGCKWCYMGHRRFLDIDDKWRLNRNFFNGKTKRGLPPASLSGYDVWKK